MHGRSFRSHILLRASLLVVPLVIITAVSWYHNNRAANELSERIAKQQIGWTRSQVDRLSRKALEHELIVRQVVTRTPFDQNPDLRSQMTQLLPLFDVHKELSYIGVGNVSTGNYYLLRRLPDNSPSLRIYQHAPGPRRILDYRFGAKGLEEMPAVKWDSYDFRERPYFQKLLAENRPTWTKAYSFWKGNERGEVPGITYVSPIRNAKGEIVGAIDVDYDVNAICDYLAEVENRSPGFAIVAEVQPGETPVLIGHPSASNVIDPQTQQLRSDLDSIPHSATREALRQLPRDPQTLALESGRQHQFRANFQSHLMTYQVMQGTDEPRWAIVSVIPESEALGNIPQIQRWYGIAVFLLLLGLLYAAYHFSRSLARPLSEIEQQAFDLAEGERRDPIRVHGPREVQSLGESFNRVLSRVLKRESQLRGLNEELRAESAQRVRALKELRESRQQLEDLFMNTTDAITLYNVQADQTLVVERMNPAMLEALNQPMEQAIGSTVHSLLPLAQANEMISQSQESLSRGKPINFLHHVQLPDREIWFDTVVVPLRNAERKVVRLAVTARNVTESQKTRTALVTSERKFAAMFRLSPIALLLTRAHDGLIVDVNQGFEQLYRIPREQALGKTTIELGLFQSADDRQWLYHSIKKHKRLHNVENVYTFPNGETIVLASDSELITLDDQEYLITCSVDVTARKKAEAVLRETNETLERRVADRTRQLAAANNELEAFCYSVSHDLRAPLRSIDGFSKALIEDYTEVLDDDGRDFLRRIRNGCRRMSELIDDLLMLSRVSRSEMKLETVNLSSLSHEILGQLQTQHPTRKVECSIAPNLHCEADPQLLRVLMENLLSNAWKYTSKKEEAKIEVGELQGTNERVFYVRDNGAGFDPTYAGKLFQPFQRLHRPDEFEGHGIGLATVQRIINRHGGKVRAEGELHHGATIYFTLENTTEKAA